MLDAAEILLLKAEESLAGAEREFAGTRFNNCANRCYYACFQAAIVALLHAGIRPTGAPGQWGHAFVQAQFSGQLVHRRKLFPSTLRDTLNDNLVLRHRADYEPQQVTERQALRALRRAQEFLAAIQTVGGQQA